MSSKKVLLFTLIFLFLSYSQLQAAPEIGGFSSFGLRMTPARSDFFLGATEIGFVWEFKEKYAELLIQKEREFEEKFKEVKIHKNPKRLNVFAGAGISFSNPTDTHFLGGFTYPVWGPFTAGAQATTDGTAAVMVGFRF